MGFVKITGLNNLYNHTQITHFWSFSVYTEFETLLAEQAPIEAYIDWLESLVHRSVVQVKTYNIG